MLTILINHYLLTRHFKLFNACMDPNDLNGSSTIGLHNLGGCSMGKERDHGVVDSLGRVYKKVMEPH
jgi:GMC oxidoreductase